MLVQTSKTIPQMLQTRSFLLGIFENRPCTYLCYNQLALCQTKELIFIENKLN